MIDETLKALILDTIYKNLSEFLKKIQSFYLFTICINICLKQKTCSTNNTSCSFWFQNPKNGCLVKNMEQNIKKDEVSPFTNDRDAIKM